MDDEEDVVLNSDEEDKNEDQEDDKDIQQQSQEQKMQGVREVFKKNVRKFVHNIHSECQELNEEQKKELQKDPNILFDPEKLLEQHDDSKCTLIEQGALDLLTEKVIMFLQNLIHKSFQRSLRRDPNNDVILDADLLYILKEDPQLMNKVCLSILQLQQIDKNKDISKKKISLKQLNNEFSEKQLNAQQSTNSNK